MGLLLEEDHHPTVVVAALRSIVSDDGMCHGARDKGIRQQ
jgi:hypothetical protein